MSTIDLQVLPDLQRKQDDDQPSKVVSHPQEKSTEAQIKRFPFATKWDISSLSKKTVSVIQNFKDDAKMLVPFLLSFNDHIVIEVSDSETIKQCIISLLTEVVDPDIKTLQAIVACTRDYRREKDKFKHIGELSVANIPCSTTQFMLSQANSIDYQLRKPHWRRENVLRPENVKLFILQSSQFYMAWDNFLGMLPKHWRCMMFVTKLHPQQEAYQSFKKMKSPYAITIDPIRKSFAGLHYILVETPSKDERNNALLKLIALEPFKKEKLFIMVQLKRLDSVANFLQQHGIDAHVIRTPVTEEDLKKPLWHNQVILSSQKVETFMHRTIIINHSYRISGEMFMKRNPESTYKAVISLISWQSQKDIVNSLEAHLQRTFYRVDMNALDQIPSILSEKPVNIQPWDIYVGRFVGPLLWRQCRVLWIGWKKNQYPECLIPTLPKEILKYILQLANR